MPKITTPWTKEIVDALNAWQKQTTMHPFTCLEHSDVPLIATQEGWHCEAEVGCDYTQNWAWDFMAKEG